MILSDFDKTSKVKKFGCSDLLSNNNNELNIRV